MPRPNIRLSDLHDQTEVPNGLDWLTLCTWALTIALSLAFWGLLLLWAVWGRPL